MIERVTGRMNYGLYVSANYSQYVVTWTICYRQLQPVCANMVYMLQPAAASVC